MRTVGIGGIIIASQDPERLRAWYGKYLGIDVADWGGAVIAQPAGDVAWSVTAADKIAAPYVINYRVTELDAVLAELKKDGYVVADSVEESEFGRFGWATDPDGNRIELWQTDET